MTMHDVTVPHWGQATPDATVTRWLKDAGDTVAAGDAVVEVETEKVNAEVEAPASGRLVEILARVGATVTAGEVLGRIEQEDAT